MNRKSYFSTLGIGVISKTVKFCVKVSYVMGRMLLGELSCSQTDLVLLVIVTNRKNTHWTAHQEPSLLQLPHFNVVPLLQIGRGNMDNLGIIGHIPPLNIFCDPSLEPSHRDSSNEASQHMFLLRNKKNYLSLILWSSANILGC